MKVEKPQGVGYERHNQPSFKHPPKSKSKTKGDEYTPSPLESLSSVELTPQQKFLIDGVSFTETEIEVIKKNIT